MKHLKWKFLVFASILFLSTQDNAYSYTKPNSKLTPGASDPKATKAMVCKHGYTKDVRHVTLAMKKQVMHEYGLDPKTMHAYEIDHFVSLELGGLNDVSNLWPQPIKEARLKDVVETSLHRQMCKPGSNLTIQEVQKRIYQWEQEYTRMESGK